LRCAIVAPEIPPAANAFGEMKGIGVKGNRTRDFEITRKMAQAVIDACPDAEWRLVFALRRCPSEHLASRWGDIDFARGRMTVHSSKTAHHEGKEFRIVPIFADLREYLEDARELAGELADDPATPVISRYRSANANLRTQLQRIIKRAGLKPWPKLFQNLRATRETELAEDFPIHVVCEWIGNSQAVAKKHYLQVTDEHFKAAQKAVQKSSEPAGTVVIIYTGSDSETPGNTVFAGLRRKIRVDGTRLEQMLICGPN
jgi:integrase